MLPETSRQTRTIVVAVVLIAAILMIVFVPFVAFDMVNPIVDAQLARIAKFEAENNPQAPLLTYTTWLVSFFFPFWGTMSLVAGLALLVIALPLFRGESWARGLALLCLSIPSMGGAYMIVPWMNFIGSQVGGFPPAVSIMMIGLIGYFTVLLADRGDLVQKAVDFFVFLMLGVTAAENFANGHAAFRILFGHPARPKFAEGIAITYFGWLTLWVAAVLLILAIYLLGARKPSGWYVGLIGAAVTIVGSGATHYVRHATNDYLYGALMGLSVLVLLLIPVCKQRLLNAYQAGESSPVKGSAQPARA